MKKIIEQLPDIKLAGITVRTNNATIFQQDPSVNVIAATVQKYFHGGLPDQIFHRAKPGVTYCAYTEYESDLNGDYTYFIGEEVSSFEGQPEEFKTLIIPAQNYVKFTNEPGPMPDVCISMWKNIWEMTPSELGGSRGYEADFELYDGRASDHQNAILDIYIGIT